MRAYHVDGWQAYSQLRSTDEWRKYLRDRQDALQSYAKQRDYRVSARDTCGQRTTDALSKCFNDKRDYGVNRCDWCASAPMHEVPGLATGGRALRARSLSLLPQDPPPEAFDWRYTVPGYSNATIR